MSYVEYGTELMYSWKLGHGRSATTVERPSTCKLKYYDGL